jgi:hypothetical protein
MGWWSSLWQGLDKEQGEKNNEGWKILLEIRKAHSDWERAYLMFNEAMGQDQIDYAIYILDAAERKYQIHLKQAKSMGVNSSRI